MNTKPIVTPEALAFYKAAGNVLDYLAARWADEKDYENLDTYLLPLSPIADKTGVVLTGMTKRPFGVKYRVGEKVFHAFVRGNSYAYKRIG